MFDAKYIAIELFGVWIIQLIIYILKAIRIVKWNIKKIEIFFIAGLVFLFSPFLYSINGGYNPETDEYICGLPALIPIALFWFIGIFGNIILLVSFYLVDAFLSRYNKIGSTKL